VHVRCLSCDACMCAACPVMRACALPVLCLCCLQRDLNGHSYYEFEYTAKNSRYTRHSLAVVVVNDGKGQLHCCCAQPTPHYPVIAAGSLLFLTEPVSTTFSTPLQGLHRAHVINVTPSSLSASCPPSPVCPDKCGSRQALHCVGLSSIWRGDESHCF